jgi:hypothetical protein
MAFTLSFRIAAWHLSMEADISKAQLSFAKALRAFQTGGICYDDLLGHLDQYLQKGAVRTDLLETLRRRESVEPLPDHVYLTIWSRLRRVAHPVADSTGLTDRPMALVPTERVDR